MERNILEVEKLNVSYGKKQVLHDVSFSMKEGETIGLVGESGSGKTTLAKAILGLLPVQNGSIRLLADRPQMVFQDPFGSLNPAKTIGWILEEPLRNCTQMTKEERKEEVIKMMEKVGLPLDLMEHYPDELSGGQRQRVGIGAALITKPKLLIADEPVSALDVTIQAQILKLLKKLQQEMGLSVLFISHDLRVVFHMCNQVLIMKNGIVVERGGIPEVYRHPQHEYTKELLQAAGIQ